MNNFIKIALLFSTLSYQAASQNFNLEWGVPAVGKDLYILEVNSSGEVLQGGVFSGTKDFDPSAAVYNLSSATSDDPYILRLDPAGNFIGVLHIDPGLSIIKTFMLDDGTFTLIMGGTGDMDPGPGTILINTSGDNFGVIRFDSNLQYIDHATWSGGLGMFELANGKYIGMFGNYIAMDLDPGPGVFNTIPYITYMARYDYDFNFISAQPLNNPPPDLLYPTVDFSGNYYFMGRYESDTTDLCPGPAVCTLALTIPNVAGNKNYYICKMDSMLNLQWVTGYAKYSFTEYPEIRFSSDGSVYFSDKVQQGDIIYPVYNTPAIIMPDFPLQEGRFFIQYDSNGQHMRHMKLPVEYMSDFVIDQDKRLHLTGHMYYYSVDFDPSGANYTLTNANVGDDVFFASYDSTFSFLSAFQFEGANDFNAGKLALQSGSENIFLVGNNGDPVDIDVTTGQHMITPAGPENGFIAKYNTSSFMNVWPGDANEDLQVDNFDLLQIGLYNGDTGPARFTISNTWQPYFAENWLVNQNNGNDKKYADCNGNGTISLTDATAINLNFGLGHPLRIANPNKVASGENLYFAPVTASVAPGGWVDVDVMIDNPANSVTLYGIAFNISYDSSLVVNGSTSITYPPSWLGTTGVNTINLSKNSAGTTHGAVTRYNHTNATGSGKIATFRFQAAQGINVNTYIPLTFSDYEAITQDGNTIPFTATPDSILIDPLLGVNEIKNDYLINIFPNVTNDNFTLNFSLLEQSKIKVDLTNTIGQQVMNIENEMLYKGDFNKQYDIAGLPAGIYLLQLQVNDELIVHKIIKM